MITTAVVGFFLDAVTWMVGLFPTFTLPDALQPSSIVASVEPLAAALGAADAYVSATALVVGSVAVLAAFVVAFAIRLVRIIASYATLGGGM